MKAVTYFKALADETRLRLVNLLMHNELNVNEIVSIMHMGQSRISRHLKILTDSELLESRRDGLWVFYKAAIANGNVVLMEMLQKFCDQNEELQQDLLELQESIAQKGQEKTRFFDAIAKDWDDIKENLFGNLNLEQEILNQIPECNVAADLGCGTGELLPYLTQKASVIIGVDKSPEMLNEAQKRFSGENTDIDLRIGEIEHLPMRDKEADVAIINMVLHHVISPQACIYEAARVLQKNKSLIIVDLHKHSNEQMRERYGHRWLGFAPKEIDQWLGKSGFKLVDTVQFDAEKDLKVNMYIAIKR